MTIPPFIHNPFTLNALVVPGQDNLYLLLIKLQTKSSLM